MQVVRDCLWHAAQGLDDRYDGSGWTTFKKKDDGQKGKFKLNKEGGEKKRKAPPRAPKQPGESI